MSAQNIYNLLRAGGLSHAGACGTMGNLKAESGLKANIAQRGMTSLSDEAYTGQADAGSSNFARDGIGYGLAQWTYWSRKQALLAYAVLKGASVGDESMQVEFLLKELKEDYSSLYTFLCGTDDMYQATSRFCKEFERPAYNNIGTRYSYAQEYADFRLEEESDTVKLTETAAEPVSELQTIKCTPEVEMLSKGFKIASVKRLQELLLARGYSEVGAADGDFGTKTETAVKNFQTAAGLTVDGVVGKNTWQALLTTW